MYGMEIFTHIGLFYGMFMPWGDHLSLDVFQGRRRALSSVAAGVTRKMLQLQMCIVYLSSGLEKASGLQWRNGDAIWRSVMLPSFHQFDMSWLAQVPSLALASGWLVISIESGYAFLIWWPKTRSVWLGLTIGMHTFIGLILGMWLFSLFMIVLNLGAFGYDALRDWGAIAERTGPPTQRARLEPVPASHRQT